MSKASDFIRENTKRCSNETSSVEGGGLKATFYHEWLTPENALAAVDIEREEVIEKACESIKDLLSGYIIRNFHFGDSYDIDKLIEDFRKAMKKGE